MIRTAVSRPARAADSVFGSSAPALQDPDPRSREESGGRGNAPRDGGGTLRVLVVEDEKNLVRLLRGYFEREGFEVSEALDGLTGIEAVREEEPDVVVLDWMLPRVDGVEVLRRLREFSKAYVIMLSARSEETDRIVGLSSGADDYLTKPFSPGELIARVRAMLRRPRAGGNEDDSESVMKFGELTVDPGAREVYLGREPVELTTLEFDLLSVLASRPGFVFSRSRLLERVWGEGYFGSGHVVDVHVANLRKKLGEDASAPRYVETVRGVGYRFVRR
ncbi:MAG: response regulator transcription factor [Rubrobacteraceae bacterium]